MDIMQQQQPQNLTHFRFCMKHKHIQKIFTNGLTNIGIHRHMMVRILTLESAQEL